MRYLFACIIVVLAGCGGRANVLTGPTTAWQPQSLHEICDSMREYTVQVASSRLGRRERKAHKEEIERLSTTPLHPIIREDMVAVLETTYTLPIETYEDANAIANLVYRNCILKNQ